VESAGSWQRKYHADVLYDAGHGAGDQFEG